MAESVANLVERLLSEYDPPKATLVHTFCERCGEGGKDSPEYFFTATGREVSWEEIERTIERVIAARSDA